MSLCVVIPAYNEEATIVRVINSVHNYCDCVVVNDNSKDSTAALAKKHGAHLVSHKSNKGYEASLYSGLTWARDNGYTRVITMDGDDQHPYSALSKYDNLLQNSVSVVFGVRDRKQRFAEIFIAYLTNFMWGIKDPLCGMKGYNIEALNLITKDYKQESIGTKFALIPIIEGYSFSQVKILTKNRPMGPTRYGDGIKINFFMISSFIKFFYLTLSRK